MNKSLRGQVVIAFRSNSYCFWEIWADPGSIPRVGTWFFFFVQINYFKFFMYVCLSYNDKKQSKLSSNLLKITLNFWTVWSTNSTQKPVLKAWLFESIEKSTTNTRKELVILHQCEVVLHVDIYKSSNSVKEMLFSKETKCSMGIWHNDVNSRKIFLFFSWIPALALRDAKSRLFCNFAILS